MDSVSHLPGSVMEAQSALMAVMNSTAVSSCSTLSMFASVLLHMHLSIVQVYMDSVIQLPSVVMETMQDC